MIMKTQKMVFQRKMDNRQYNKKGAVPKSRIVPFAIVYFGKKYYLTVAKNQTL